MLRHTTSMVSHLPREWRCDADTCSFVSDGAAIRVIALHAREAALLDGAREQVEDLYRDLFEIANHPVSRAKNAVARAFHEPSDPIEAARPARTILVYYDAKPDEPSDRVAAYTRVVYDGERVVISSIAVTFELTEDAQHQVLRATTLATEELATEMARDALKDDHATHSIMIWRGQLGANDYLKTLFERDGYSTKLTDRLEMTAHLKELQAADVTIDDIVIDGGVEFRPLDLANDDIKAVYDVLKDAFGGSPPSFEAWKRHYPQQPRFAPELSFVAWQGDKPIAVSCLELIVEGEGGGDDEVAKVYNTDGVLLDDAKKDPYTQALKFADDYEQRKQELRAVATVAYVCGIATLPAFRGKRLGQTLLRHNFRAAARAGLESVFLGTDRHNPAAVRAYLRAGMVETKAENAGLVTAKVVTATP